MIARLNRRHLLLGGLAAVTLPRGLIAQTALLPAKGPALLTVTGKIGRSNAVDTTGAPKAVFDAELLDALPQHTVVTDTFWDTDQHAYRGPLLRDVMTACGVDLSTGSFKAQAINDFASVIPMEDITRWPVLLARFMDEQPLPRRTKGPLWIMYPRRGEPALEWASIRNRWVWQLDRIIIL
ncbi:MAG: hypothetical protein ACOVKO_10160 [Elstera sp.]